MWITACVDGRKAGASAVCETTKVPVPPEPRYRIRVANKAVIVRDDALLVTVNEDDGGYDVWYALPGGGQEWGEDAVTALRRECCEEIGCDVEVGELLGVRDYVAQNHQFAHLDSDFHQQENFFACTLAEGQDPRMTSTGDTYQTGFRWIPLRELPRSPLFPEVLRTRLLEDPAARRRYLGDVN